MRTSFLASFLADVKKLRDARIRRAVTRAIESVERAPTINEIASLKRLSGYREYYRT
jgi:hypothetical protein